MECAGEMSLIGLAQNVLNLTLNWESPLLRHSLSGSPGIAWLGAGDVSLQASIEDAYEKLSYDLFPSKLLIVVDLESLSKRYRLFYLGKVDD